jgi:hypothetical protein
MMHHHHQDKLANTPNYRKYNIILVPLKISSSTSPRITVIILFIPMPYVRVLTRFIARVSSKEPQISLPFQHFPILKSK